ncbi:MAG: DNA alkylation repair protein [Firmicutes bacterium]|nr:DNA alkylation repair protein [Bacillota bacterium]
MKYDDFLNELYSLQDLKYKDFHSKLIMSDKLVGVRTPELKRIAKVIARSNYEEFFKENRHELYEENLVHGLVLGYLKLEFNDLKPLVDEFIPHIDNWAVCDATVANLKVYKKNKTKDIVFNEIKNYIKDDNPWINRFGYVMLLEYFIEEKYINEIFELCSNYKEEYYVKMAIAWLISMCYIKFKGRTLTFLKKNKLDVWTHNKAIQKTIESYRVTEEDKKMLRSLKRK